MDVRYLMLALTGFIEYNQNIFKCKVTQDLKQKSVNLVLFQTIYSL